VLVCLLIPYQAIALPIYILFFSTGILNTYASLVLPFTISVFGIFLMRQFFLGVPDDLIDAARIDGMSEYRIVWGVMAPTAMPALVAFGIFSLVAHWNDYFWPLIAVAQEELYTPPLGISHLKLNGEGTAYGPLMAAATIVITPLVLAFLVAQRRFIEGITFTGLKG
jgi:multiple sugar transport system permease protein